jgi:hypothetical protein
MATPLAGFPQQGFTPPFGGGKPGQPTKVQLTYGPGGPVYVTPAAPQKFDKAKALADAVLAKTGGQPPQGPPVQGMAPLQRHQSQASISACGILALYSKHC